jgi:dTDP-glucose pyrophosphorylase
MSKHQKYTISKDDSIKSALVRLNSFSKNDGLTLFVINKEEQLCGTLTDGDIRRGLLLNSDLDQRIESIMNTSYIYIKRNSFTAKDIQQIKLKGIEILPLIDDKFKIDKLINLSKKQSVIPVDAVIMAGGKGERLLPLTANTPKPLLMVGDKPIIEHNIDRLGYFGIDHIYITIKYLGELIKEYLNDGTNKEMNIKYVSEVNPLGTIGAISLIDSFTYEDVLIMNSDLLTNIDWENFYNDFKECDADVMIATVPYQVQIPYAVLETNELNNILSFKEKPTYTYYSNAGIYLIKRNLLGLIPKNSFYNATDLIEELIKRNKKVVSYSILGYWLDIGRHEDYKKANEDIKHIKL